jgi:hypothetical protein
MLLILMLVSGLYLLARGQCLSGHHDGAQRQGILAVLPLHTADLAVQQFQAFGHPTALVGVMWFAVPAAVLHVVLGLLGLQVGLPVEALVQVGIQVMLVDGFMIVRFVVPVLGLQVDLLMLLGHHPPAAELVARRALDLAVPPLLMLIPAPQALAVVAPTVIIQVPAPLIDVHVPAAGVVDGDGDYVVDDDDEPELQPVPAVPRQRQRVAAAMQPRRVQPRRSCNERGPNPVNPVPPTQPPNHRNRRNRRNTCQTPPTRIQPHRSCKKPRNEPYSA